jgi:hypothetical protein
MVSREGIDHVGEAEGRSRVAEADAGQTSPNAVRAGLTLTFASWNRIREWLTRIETVRHAA